MEYIHLLNQALCYIEDNLMNEITIKEIAKQMQVSEHECKRLFAFVIGTPISDYIRFRRLSVAGQDIAKTEEPIGDIAAKYQYYNQSAFSRAFKEFHHHTPLEIRKKGVSLLEEYSPHLLEKQKQMDFTIIELPSVRMARSGKHSLKGFDEWWSKKFNKETNLFPKDFMWNNEITKKLEWLYIVDEDEDTGKYETFQFPGGLYATITTEDTSKKRSEAYFTLVQKTKESREFDKSTPENDPNYHLKYSMGHVSTPRGFTKHQFTIFVPIVKK